MYPYDGPVNMDSNFFPLFWKLINFLKLFPQLYANRQKWRWRKINKRKQKKNKKNIARIRLFCIIMLTGNKAFFLNQLPLFPEDKPSWDLESWWKVCHGFFASWGEAVFLSLWSSALHAQCFKNFTFRLSAHLLTTLNTTPPPQPSHSSPIYLYTRDNVNIQMSLKV